MAGKKKGRRIFSPETKAAIVREALETKANGGTMQAVAKKHKIVPTLLTTWVGAAKASGSKPSPADPGKKASASGDVVSLSRELAEAMERVAKIKKRLRKLLGAE